MRLNTAGFSITTQPGAEVDLFVKGDLVINGPSSFGSAASPVSVRTYVGGNLSVQASALFAGNVYAPPCSQGPGAKVYTFTLYALSAKPVLPATAKQVTGPVLGAAMQGLTLATSSVSVSYTRPN